MRILVVDPDADNRDSWSLLLSCWGHQVRVAADTPSALEQSHAFRPQAVLMEVILPGGDGWQLACRLRAGCSLLVAITGYSRWDGPARAEAAGFDFFLTKPAEPSVVQGILARAEPQTGAGLGRAGFELEGRGSDVSWSGLFLSSSTRMSVVGN